MTELADVRPLPLRSAELPWFLSESEEPMLKAATVLLMAMAEDRERRGLPTPPLDALLTKALSAWTARGTERERMSAAFTVLLSELAA
jgi:hypothetical protein